MKKKLKTYTVTLCRTYHAWADVTVQTYNKKEAAQIAQEKAKDFGGMQYGDNDTIVSIEEAEDFKYEDDDIEEE